MARDPFRPRQPRVVIDATAPQIGLLGIHIPVVDDVGDAIKKLWHGVPGSQWIEHVTGDIKDSAVGGTILDVLGTAFSGSAYAALGPLVGPQLASVAFALPGMAQGQDFTKAWLSGFTSRLKQLVDIGLKELTPMLTDQLNTALDSLKQSAEDLVPGAIADGADKLKDALAQVDITPDDLAKSLGIRYDVAGAAVGAIHGNVNEALNLINNYDPATGFQQVPICDQADQAVQLAFSPALTGALQVACANAKAIDEARKEAAVKASLTLQTAKQSVARAMTPAQTALLNSLGFSNLKTSTVAQATPPPPAPTPPIGPVARPTTPVLTSSPPIDPNVMALADAMTKSVPIKTSALNPDAMTPSSHTTLFEVLAVTAVLGCGALAYRHFRR